MKTLRHAAPSSPERGAALLLSLIILFVLIAIMAQINISTSTDARIARNDIGFTSMDLAIESAFLQTYDQVASDAASGGAAPGGAAGGSTGGGAPAPASGGAAAADPGAASGGGQSTDSRRDEWAQVQRTEINEIKLRIFVQDEDSKLNVLTLLNPDEKEAQAALDRVVRCLDLCREGTDADISERVAEDMARDMLEFMKQRNLARLPRPTLLTDDEQSPDIGLPLSLRDFAVLPTFDESLFRDYRDEDGNIVHSIGSFLTVWTSLSTRADDQEAQSSSTGGTTPGANPPPSGTPNPTPPPSGNPPPPSGQPGENPPASGGAAAGGAGAQAQSNPGWSVNVNTAPVAVLKSLFDDRDVHPRLWDKVVEYRNLEEEEEDDEEEEETAVYDEFGEEVIERRIFDSLSELSEVDGFNDLGAETQTKVRERLTTQSNVFSIYIVARRSTSAEGDPVFADPESRRLAEEQGDALVRVVRAVVWRRSADDETEIVPIVRWEALDYVPYEVQDYPDERR